MRTECYWGLLVGICALVGSALGGTPPRAEPRFVYVVALERETPDQPGTSWPPTLYKVDVREGKVAGKLKLPDQGAPLACAGIGDTIRILIQQGWAANGALPSDEEVNVQLDVDKNTMKVVRRERRPGAGDEAGRYEYLDRLGVKRPRPPAGLEGRLPKGKRFLAQSADGRRLYVSEYDRAARAHSIEVLDAASLGRLDLIRVTDGRHPRGGLLWDTSVALLGDRFLVCLFEANNALGEYGPGYVMILDTMSKSVKFVEIGSDPADGIAY